LVEHLREKIPKNLRETKLVVRAVYFVLWISNNQLKVDRNNRINIVKRKR